MSTSSTAPREAVGFVDGSNVSQIGKWVVGPQLGRGAFGEVFMARHASSTSEAYTHALKLETPSVADERAGKRSRRCVIKLEARVLTAVEPHESLPAMAELGRISWRQYYLVMDLHGEALSHVRRRIKPLTFSVSATLEIGRQVLRALQRMHACGFIHRDIKPSNIVLHRTRKSRVVLIDFGLARQIIKKGKHLPPRDSVTGFRGTTTYASLAAHLHEDLGRRDDLWSLLYVLVEFIQGRLPWTNERDKEAVGRMKAAARSPDVLLGESGPASLRTLQEHLLGLGFADAPDYDMLFDAMSADLIDMGETGAFDWAATATTRSTYASSFDGTDDDESGRGGDDGQEEVEDAEAEEKKTDEDARQDLPTVRAPYAPQPPTAPKPAGRYTALRARRFQQPPVV